jgi:signal transduction histidine kinase
VTFVTDADRDEAALLDALPDGAVVADEAGLVLAVNRSARTMLGLDDDAWWGRPLSEVLTLLDSEGRDWVTCSAPYSGLASRTGIPEQSWLLPDGEEVLVAATMHRDAPRGPVTRVGISLRSGRGRARLDRERSDLVATVAHELRSPLTGVKGFVQAVLNRWEKLNDEQKKLMLTTVNADADRLSRLIAELLDVARIDTGRLSLYPRPVDARVQVQRVVEMVQAGTARPIKLDAADDLPEVRADPDKLTQVVTNLVENAVRHGDGTVTVTLERLAAGAGPAPADVTGVLLTVDDEGEGIAPDLRRRVFTKFWTGGVRGGSGLGMYIVNGLAKAHGGHVAIGESPAGGARIQVSWPESHD